MVGGSYGGGIQFVTAATDCRVDAIVPTIAWHSLTTSLYKSGIAKSGWSGILVQSVVERPRRPRGRGRLPGGPGDRHRRLPTRWPGSPPAGPAQHLRTVHIPTLIVQGTVDTLFTLQEGVDNYEVLRAAGVPTAMQWFCGGHGVCLTPAGDTAAAGAGHPGLAEALRAAGHRGRHRTGLQLRRPERHHLLGPVLPRAPGDAGDRQRVRAPCHWWRRAARAPSPRSRPDSSWAAWWPPSPRRRPPTPLTSRSPSPEPVVVVGAPRLVLTYSGTVPAGTRPTRVFAQLVDRSTGLVLGNQVTPVARRPRRLRPTRSPCRSRSSPTRRRRPRTSSCSWWRPRCPTRSPGSAGPVHFASIRLALPTAAGLTPVTSPSGSATASTAG